MNMLVFNFQNMMNMEKIYAYRNFSYVAYKKTYKNEYFVHQKTSKTIKKGLIAFITSMHIIICRRRISTSKGLKIQAHYIRKNPHFVTRFK